MLSLAAASAAVVTLAVTSNAQAIPGASSYNGLNLVPQMGWDNWNAFACNVDEDLLLGTAKNLSKWGLKDMGYQYIVLDDCWSSGRNESGFLMANATRFPHGMKYIADQLHGMGMKFGMYSSAGIYTCAKYPGSLGSETKDAQFFAENNVDYLKYDNCYNNGESGTSKLSYDRYKVMSDALNATGRPILYSLCNWGQDQPYGWAQYISNSDRMSGDIYDSFDRPDANCPCQESPCVWPGYHCSIMNILNKMAPIVSRSQPGWFNDLDALEVGNGGQDDNEYVTHFSMWSFVSSPLIMGTDVSSLSPANFAIYANPAVIALNQDITGGAGNRIWQRFCDDVDIYGKCETNLWSRTMNNGDKVIALINASNSTMKLNASLTDIFTEDALSGASKPPAGLSENWDVYDLWGYRMNNTEAAMVLNGTAGDISPNSTTRYNATAMSYADGLEKNAPALFGKKISSIGPYGTVTANVPRHSTALYRLKSRVASKMKRDEL